jgi:hypothetical protein
MRKFDLQGWLRQFRNSRARGLELGISEDETTRAEEIIGAGFELNDQIFGNGDFYPRNLVKLPPIQSSSIGSIVRAFAPASSITYRTSSPSPLCTCLTTIPG